LSLTHPEIFMPETVDELCSVPSATLWALIPDGIKVSHGCPPQKEPNGADIVNTTVSEIRKLGPYTEYKS